MVSFRLLFFGFLALLLCSLLSSLSLYFLKLPQEFCRFIFFFIFLTVFLTARAIRPIRVGVYIPSLFEYPTSLRLNIFSDLTILPRAGYELTFCRKYISVRPFFCSVGRSVLLREMSSLCLQQLGSQVFNLRIRISTLAWLSIRLSVIGLKSEIALTNRVLS